MASTTPPGTDPYAYEQQPEAIKLLYTPKEWAWLGWEGRQSALDRECLPDVGED